MNARVMLDLETYSTKPNACILSIGACFFGLDGIGAKFYQPLQYHNQATSWGRHVEAGTVEWWSQQSPEARQVLNDPRAVEFQHGMANFCDWVLATKPLGQKVEMWGNGADFDCVILGGAIEAAGHTRPWSYSYNRCFRTLKNIVKLRPGFGIPAREGTHHNALDDAIYQAECAAVYLKELER